MGHFTRPSMPEAAGRVSRVTKPKPSPDVRLEMEHEEVEEGTDFVCLSAFSEVEGPCMVSVVPEVPRPFDKKAYALKIMSVDLHNQNNTNLFIHDSQSVIPEDHLRCYVHHSFFLDLRARGYARPLSFSYITQDQEKIMSHLDQFMDEFTHVADILRYGNHLIFLKELEEQLNVLEEKLESQTPTTPTDTQPSPPSASPPRNPPFPSIVVTDAVENMAPPQEAETQQSSPAPEESTTPLLSTPHASDEEHSGASELPQPETQSIDQAQESDANPMFDSPILSPQEIKVKKSSRITRSISAPIPESPGMEEGDYTTTPSNASIDALRAFITEAKAFYERGEPPGPNPAMGDLVEALSNSKDLKQELHAALLEKRAVNKSELRDFPVICGPEHYEFAMKRIERIRAHFSRRMEVLSLEAEELASSVPLSTLLSFGRFPTLNFNWEHEHSPKNFLQFPALSIGPSAHGVKEPTEEVRCPDDSSHLLRPAAITPTDTQSEVESFSDDEGLLQPSGDAIRGDDSPSLSYRDLPTHNVLVSRETHMPTNIDSGRIYDPLYPRRLPTASEFGLIELESTSAVLWGETTQFAGAGLYGIRSRYSFLSQLVYSLLIGRPVIVYAIPTNRKQLELLLRALSLFIPGCWRKEAVCEWQTAPLRATDLSHYKLIGLSKSQSPGTHPVPQALRKYVTMMDFDENILYAPPFRSAFVDNYLLPPKRHFLDESSFLAYLHCELYVLATKGCLYYEMCCLTLTTLAEGADPPPARPVLTSLTNDEILRKYCPSAAASQRKGKPLDPSVLCQLPLHLREDSRMHFANVTKGSDASDLPIIEYLAEVIKEQQAMEMNEVDCRYPVLRLVEMPIEKITNQVKKKT